MKKPLSWFLIWIVNGCILGIAFPKPFVDWRYWMMVLWTIVLSEISNRIKIGGWDEENQNIMPKL